MQQRPDAAWRTVLQVYLAPGLAGACLWMPDTVSGHKGVLSCMMHAHS